MAEGTKLNPDTPIPLQLPPAGVPTSVTSVSLIQILCNGCAVTFGFVTVRIAALEVTV